MQERPTGWPIEGAIESLPEVFIRLPGSSWPPARSTVPAGTGECTQWRVARSLTGGMLPGQVRGASGFSVASSDVSIPQSKSRMSPWATGGYQLAPGGEAHLYASHDGANGSTALPLGRFRVDPISGTSTDPSLVLDLIEDSGRLKRPVAIKWDNTSSDPDSYTMDASWVLDQIARAGGFYATPKPDAGTVLSLPLVGGPASDRGITRLSTIDRYREFEHCVGLAGASSIDVAMSGTGVGDVFYFSAQVAGSGGLLRMGDVIFSLSPADLRVSEASTVKATITLGGTGLVTVQGRVERASGGFIVQARTSGGAWSVPVTVSVTGVDVWAEDEVTVSTLSNAGFIRAVRLDGDDEAAVWVVPSAMIDLTDSPIRGIFDVESRPGWDLAQSVATSTLGGLWISETGVFTYRSRHTLRGTDAPVETVEALTQLENLTWRVDPSDIADRVAVSYIPTVTQHANDSITLWESTYAVIVNKNASTTLYANIEGTTDRTSEFLPVWDESKPGSRFSRFAASNSQFSGGSQPADSALSFATEMVGPSRIKITVTNHTSTNLWLVDGNGKPTLTLRTSVHVAPGEQVTVEQGASEENSLAPLSIDCGSTVQDHATAVQLCAWIQGQTRVAMPTIEQVRVKPDLRRQMGDIIRLTDGITELNSKAIITGIVLQGGDKGYTQVLDLALLSPVFADLDLWLETAGIQTFNDWDAWLIDQGIDTFAKFDLWLDALGRTAP